MGWSPLAFTESGNVKNVDQKIAAVALFNDTKTYRRIVSLISRSRAYLHLRYVVQFLTLIRAIVYAASVKFRVKYSK